VLETYNLLYEREDDSRVTRRGFGDTSLRLSTTSGATTAGARRSRQRHT